MMPSVVMIANSGFTMTRHHGAKIRAMVERGWKVLALADYTRGGAPEIESCGAGALQVSFEGSRANPKRNWHCVADIATMLRRAQPDVFHCIGIKQIIQGTAAARLARTSAAMVHTLTGREIMGSAHPALRFALRGLCRVAWRPPCQVIFENRDDMTDFVRRGMVDADRATHIPSCGIDIHAVPEPPERPNPTVFIHASRMLKSKGVPEFVAAAKMVKAHRPNAEFILLGGCKEDYPNSRDPDFLDRAWLEAAAVPWLGQVKPSQVERLLLSPYAAAAVLLSRYDEGVPRFPIEAAACGLPVIVSDTPGCREAVQDGETGYLCDVHPYVCIDQAATAMIELLDDPTRARRMGLAGRTHALRFDVNRVLTDTLAVYERARL